MSDGIQFLKEVSDSELKPSSIRLVDNEQFKFGQALKPQKTGWFEIFVDKLKKFYLLSILGYNVDKMVACTLMIEGNQRFCDFTLNEIKKIASKYNGILGGSENGKSGYNLTHAIAYIRDFMIDYHVIGETFETSIEWDKIEDMAESVKQTLHLECKKYATYKSLFSYRVSQCYNTGCCIYFTFGFIKNIDTTAEEAIVIFHTLEKKMREIMIAKGGSISHHHGIGQIKSHELDKSQIPVIQSIKNMFDESNVFCNNNYLHNC
jgi:alkyldihydroxyacetonephosphate synthase